MYDSETRWFIRCDTCPDDGLDPYRSRGMLSKDATADQARGDGWEVRDDLHRCSWCVREGRTAVAS